MNKKILFLTLLAIILIVPAVSNGQSPVNIVCNVRDAFFKVATGIVVIGWIIAGILWLLSAGSPEKIGTAKKATGAAVIGTAVVILSWGIINTMTNLLGTGAVAQYCP